MSSIPTVDMCKCIMSIGLAKKCRNRKAHLDQAEERLVEISQARMPLGILCYLLYLCFPLHRLRHTQLERGCIPNLNSKRSVSKYPVAKYNNTVMYICIEIRLLLQNPIKSTDKVLSCFWSDKKIIHHHNFAGLVY